MPTERTLLTHNYIPIAAANGDTVTALDTTLPRPLVTPNARLTSKDRHVTARSSGRAVFARGGTPPHITPKSPLILG